MSTAAKKPSQQEAENFHVLPKHDKQKEQARTPAQTDVGNANIVSRDEEAGSLTGSGDASAQTNQPMRGPERDRSQVS